MTVVGSCCSETKISHVVIEVLMFEAFSPLPHTLHSITYLLLVRVSTNLLKCQQAICK